MDPYLHPSELLNRSADIHRVAPAPIELGNNKHIIPVEPIDQLSKALALHGGRRTRYCFRNHSSRLEEKTSGAQILGFQSFI
jgi:hypothetical protein